MELRDIGEAIKLSNTEGWNQTEKDWKLIIENPKNICLLAESGSKVIGTTTAINYSNQVAWTGMVLVGKPHRGQGVSKALLTAIFKKTESFPSIKLDATPDGQQVYKKFGFKDEYLIDRMVNTSWKNLISETNDLLTAPIQPQHIKEIIAFDAIVFGANRAQLIEALIKEYPHKAWLMKQNNQVTGFVLGRDGNRYNQIGPVTATGIIEAKILIAKALKKLYHQPVVADVLCDKEGLIDWLSSIGFTKQRTFVRMYKKENPFPGVVGKQYLIGGPEFG